MKETQKPKFNIEKFGQAIEERQLGGDLSLRDMAKEIGVSASSLSRIKKGNEPDINSLILILDWLKLKLETFITKQ